MNKNSNAYIIIYTVVMVVIVATLLTFAATSLKERQDANAENEKKMAVMTALGRQGESFDETITPALLIDGVLTPQSDAKVVLDKLADLKTMASAENDLPLFKYEREGETLYADGLRAIRLNRGGEYTDVDVELLYHAIHESEAVREAIAAHFSGKEGVC